MKILIIEDDKNILSLLLRSLSEDGHVVQSAVSGDDGEYLADVNSYDVIILDWMLPQKSGLDVLVSLRKKNNKTPIIMLTAKSDIDDKIKGLKYGADDYLDKPFSLKELEARLEALYRRDARGGLDSIKSKDLTINFESKKVSKNGLDIFLTAKEFDLLAFLVKYNDKMVSKNMIEQELWSEEKFLNSNVIQVTVYNLRKKIGKDYIQSFRGLGYRFVF